MASDAIAFLEAMEFETADILGFSIGSFVAQEIALIRPAVVHGLVLASSAPQGAAGMHGWAREVIDAVGAPTTSRDGYLGVFFADSPASRQSGEEVLGRLTARTDDRDTPTTWETRQAQYDAVCAWGIPDHSLLQRVSATGQAEAMPLDLITRALANRWVVRAKVGHHTARGRRSGCSATRGWDSGRLRARPHRTAIPSRRLHALKGSPFLAATHPHRTGAAERPSANPFHPAPITSNPNGRPGCRIARFG